MRPEGQWPLPIRVAAGAALGVILAGIAHVFFFLGGLAWLNLILWAAIAFSIGTLSRSWASALSTTAATGFAIVLTYSILGYGATAPLASALPLFVALSLLGDAAMAAAGAVGHAVRRSRRPLRPRR